MGKLIEKIDQLFPQMVVWRRDFHANPELSFYESRTPSIVAELLKTWRIDVRTGVGGNGVIGKLQGGKPGPTVALRADMDALPIHDEKDVPYRSKIDGVMHACGHDAHTATLLGVAKLLSEQRESLHGNVVFIFQHAEEQVPGGAKAMIDDGALEGVDVVYGVHLWTPFPVGTMSTVAGPMMAAAEQITVTIQGKGGHGALPHATIDSLAVASHLVVNLQSIISRNVDPLKPAVITIGKIEAGSNFNVIAERALMTGTVRTFDPLLREEIQRRIEEVTEMTCRMFHASYVIDYLRGYPALINDNVEALRFMDVGREVLGNDNVVLMQPVMASEDFAYYLQQRQGAFCFVGAGNIEKGIHYPHHHPRFDIDERAMANAAFLLIEMTLNFMTSFVPSLHGNRDVGHTIL